MNDPTEELLKIKSKIQAGRNPAKDFLLQHFQDCEDASGGWCQFLEDKKSPSATSTAHGILSLIALGVPLSSEKLKSAQNFLLKTKQRSGGWAASNARTYPNSEAIPISMIPHSALAIIALAKFQYFNLWQLKDDLFWLLNCQNDDGGWDGGEKSGDSNVLCTAYAVRAIYPFLQLSDISSEDRKKVKAVFDSGINWLKVKKTDQGYWQKNSKEDLSSTTEALIALFECGDSPIDYLQSKDWLLTYIDNHKNLTHIHDHIGKDNEGNNWTHTLPELVLFTLSYFCISEPAMILNPLLLELAEYIQSYQKENGGWESSSVNGQPIWATKQAVVCLTRYLGILESESRFILLENRIYLLEKKVEIIEKKQRNKFTEILYNFFEFICCYKWSILFSIFLLILICYLAYEANEQNASTTIKAVYGVLVTILGIIGVKYILMPFDKLKNFKKKNDF